jgi:hypothetical protein
VAFSLAAHVAASETMQLVINERVQFVEGGLISIAPLGE